MPLFKYKAVDGDQKVTEGVKEAADRFVLYRELRTSGLSVISAKEERRKGFGDFFEKFFPVGGIGTRDKIMLAENLGSMIAAGLPLSRAIEVLIKQSASKKLKSLLAGVNDSVRRGTSLSAAMAERPKVFSELFVSMVRAGEESGSLAGSLKSVGAQMKSVYLLGKKVKGAMIYPVMVLTIMAIIGALMMIYVVPTLQSTFSDLNVDLPFSTRTVIAFSGVLTNHLAEFLILFVAVIGGFRYLTKLESFKSAMDAVLLRVPVIGSIIIELNVARTSRTLSSLVSAGVDVVDSMNITNEVVQNHSFRKLLSGAGEIIKKGESIAKVFSENTRLYPSFVGEMVAIGEETGKLSEMLGNVATYYEESVSQKTKNMSTVIEPFLMIVIGAFVAFFALSMLTPMYSLVDSI
ncbi:MAG: hypothetical protein A3G59_02270 [Candidatus Taylorbacteria bacterium RIFCSPLOWO2_12_FULL_47_20]|uniref:Type II secretion system protein GspF domain-containing protein n=2 Tax=Candidatus Tayloriibacteriota TaxID=1817919 RepID=A0A1G2P848_9BACT|nr:MAG: hypothetical protein A3H68_03655 [Candidatus Taylorbacteria bacterium RIFCSPLOWO2_02_FULL_46_40]OHA44507.1 MAG: hypothetical protein A3G59_02270 [Candidatus Taylorbacteria bacterium RIFCSPLOWO2_12_FULL_47_20]